VKVKICVYIKVNLISVYDFTLRSDDGFSGCWRRSGVHINTGDCCGRWAQGVARAQGGRWHHQRVVVSAPATLPPNAQPDLSREEFDHHLSDADRSAEGVRQIASGLDQRVIDRDQRRSTPAATMDVNLVLPAYLVRLIDSWIQSILRLTKTCKERPETSLDWQIFHRN